ncbi:hypothetical protein Syun_005584 [Stephania yunnanensis]|uniref:Flavin-containing monooxygenase n=1 Tax=Stephania yunnanensis TaxID=152371 RepID=A0AAP0L4Z3_9MAGN
MGKSPKRVAIVGAGVSGLIACKYVLEKGFHPIVFEAQSEVGGVWTHTVETTKLQTPRSSYQFSDFPWPSSVREKFPHHAQVLDYIQSYARHYDLLRFIKFNTRVIGIEFEGASNEETGPWSLWSGNGEPFSPSGRWICSVEDTLKHTRRFSGVPNIPDFPPNKGPDVFYGEVIHSMDYSAMEDAKVAEFIKGKRITVVGLQKSALDIAVECATANGSLYPCTLIYRTEHWNVPNYLPWGVHLQYLYLNRFAELMVHKPGEGYLLSFLATLLSPLRWMFSKFVESYIKWKLPLKKYKMIPKHSFSQEISSCLISTVPSNFYDKVEEGSIILRKSSKFSFCEDGVMIEGENDSLKTDLVIFATGYRGDQKLKNIFKSPTFQKYMQGSQNTTVQLYRGCIHPRIPQLAVIGYSESLSNLYTSEIRCRWLMHVLEGNVKLPSIKEMEYDTLQWEQYMKNYTAQYYKRSCVAAVHIWYNDQLLREMGFNPKRKKSFFDELFQAYGPSDYSNLSS